MADHAREKPADFGTLILKVGTVGPDPAYQDGDIITAINRRSCRHVHADRICHPRLAARNQDGLIPLDHISRHWFDLTYEFRFQRVSEHTMTRENLWTGEIDVISNTPNARGYATDVPLFVRRHRNSAGFGMFGTTGAEVWYGGKSRADTATLDRAWTMIQEKTPLREAEFADPPIGSTTLQTALVIRTTDFTDADQEALVAPVYTDVERGVATLVRKRARQVLWPSLPGMTPQRMAQIQDPRLVVDVRAVETYDRAQIVRVK